MAPMCTSSMKVTMAFYPQPLNLADFVTACRPSQLPSAVNFTWLDKPIAYSLFVLGPARSDCIITWTFVTEWPWVIDELSIISSTYGIYDWLVARVVCASVNRRCTDNRWRNHWSRMPILWIFFTMNFSKFYEIFLLHDAMLYTGIVYTNINRFTIAIFITSHDIKTQSVIAGCTQFRWAHTSLCVCKTTSRSVHPFSRGSSVPFCDCEF